jgi:predicted transcriptional regulator
MKRTTIRLDDQLLAAAKDLARRSDRTLTRVIEDALRVAISAQSEGASAPRLPRLRTVKGRLVAPIDLSDGRAVNEFLDQEEVGRYRAGG